MSGKWRYYVYWRTDGGLYTCIGESQGRTARANLTLRITESSTLAVKV